MCFLIQCLLAQEEYQKMPSDHTFKVWVKTNKIRINIKCVSWTFDSIYHCEIAVAHLKHKKMSCIMAGTFRTFPSYFDSTVIILISIIIVINVNNIVIVIGNNIVIAFTFSH